MFRLIKQVFIVLLNFSGSLVTKCVSLNNELCMSRPNLIDLNPIELNYYPFMVSLDKCSGSCNAADDLSTKTSVPSKRKDMTIKVFNMITRINEAKTLIQHISCDCKLKSISKTCNSNQKWNSETCKSECKNYCTCTNDYSWNPSICICEKGKYLKSIADTSCVMKLLMLQIVYQQM